ncbi:MAG: winged helix DNA-binding domain-containing protein [Bacteroidales bacterium]|nr:winged helix DNA-binding domain-containing protein [Bacteroidales bacterium]
MTLTNISNIRLFSQQIAATKFTTVKDIVGCMGAMQAQDYAMVKWAIGTRLPNSTIETIEKAIDQGEILRTHLLRPTWHFVSADDIYWMLELTAPKIKASLKLRHQGLELTESLIAKSNELIQKALLGGNHLTREEIVAILQNAKIATDENRTSHILMRAELDGIICSGATKNKKQTYALLSERVPKSENLTREESLKRIASRYFASRFPATLQDFVWWSGLSVSDARNALEMVKSSFISEKIGLETYWFTNSFSIPKDYNNSTYLLPAFDEFLISYKDRSASLPSENFKKAVSDNGIFRPIIVVNGQIIGIWKRTIKGEKIIVETDLFRPQSKSIKNLIEKKAIAFGNFLGKKTEVKHNI